MQAIIRDSDNKIIALNGCGHGTHGRSDMTGFSVVELPSQDITRLYEADEFSGHERLVECHYPADVTVFPADYLASQIDKETQSKIYDILHPVAGVGEEFGILRDQMVRWGNNLGLEFTLDFTRLNEVAVAAIGAARIKKESP